MRKAKKRVLQLNTQLAQILTEKGVEATADETTTALVNKVANISTSGVEIPDNALLVFADYDNEGFPTTLIHNCPDKETLPSLIYNGNATSGQMSPKIKKVVLPDYVTKISEYTFCGISGLEEVTNWDNITYVGHHAFSVNNSRYDTGKKLQHAYFPPNLTYIESYAFFRNLKNIHSEIPDTVTYIGMAAFQYGGNSGWKITKLPPYLTYIGEGSFLCYRQLLITEIPDSVDFIGKQAFNGLYDKNSLTTITFKGTPTTVETDVFINNNALTDIYVPWSEGEVANAPWGATNATIHYNHTETEEN